MVPSVNRLISPPWVLKLCDDDGSGRLDENWPMLLEERLTARLNSVSAHVHV
jgi:hypothetical protein